MLHGVTFAPTVSSTAGDESDNFSAMLRAYDRVLVKSGERGWGWEASEMRAAAEVLKAMAARLEDGSSVHALQRRAATGVHK
jgi:hypothetical protein